MSKRHPLYIAAAWLLSVSACANSDIPTEPDVAAATDNSCEFEVTGTSSPPSSGNPIVIDEITGTVISANFFNSGAIDPPYFDGMEYVSVCVEPPDEDGHRKAVITTDVGLDNDFHIKGYPEFIVGTKFGNIFETSFRYYNNTDLPPEDQWPVKTTGTDDNGEPYEFANLEYVARKRHVGLPAFTTSLPEITVTIDVDEVNVAGAERDVMLESWFHDTSVNGEIIGDNIVTNTPVAGTLNNIVGVGHRHYTALDNTLLEMMVHIGPLSPHDISAAKNNPGQNQLTEVFSGKDFDGDGIDDHFDVDSHLYIDSTDPTAPSPGIYSSGIDNDNDGIDDADLLPVVIGDFAYSIWYGESFLAPIIIYSRESGYNLANDFDPATADINLSSEGVFTLPWNDFVNYTLFDIEDKLQALNVDWSLGTSNPFPAMRSAGGAISGVEFGVEPQINNPQDDAYQLVVNTYAVTVDGVTSGLPPEDTQPPAATFSFPAADGDTIDTVSTISGSATDMGGSGIATVELAIKDLAAQMWIDFSGGFSPTAVRVNAHLASTTPGSADWSLPVTLDPGRYRAQVVVFDGERNSSGWVKQNFIVGPTDTEAPQGEITSADSTADPNPMITGTATDSGGSEIETVEVAIRDLGRQMWVDFEGGFSLTNVRATAELTNTTGNFTEWNLPVLLEPGLYRIQAVVFDNAGNNSGWIKQALEVTSVDEEDPQGEITSPDNSPTQNHIITGNAFDIGGSGVETVEVAIRDLDTQRWIDFDGGFSASNVRVPATLTNTTANSTEWNLAVTLEPGNYRVQALVFDGAGNNSGWIKKELLVGIIDEDNPQGTITNTGDTLPQNTTITGTATDTGGSGLSTVEVAIRDLGAQKWLDINGEFSDTNIRMSANLINSTTNFTEWNLPVTLAPGSYRIQAVVFDGEKNNSGWIKKTFTVSAE